MENLNRGNLKKILSFEKFINSVQRWKQYDNKHNKVYDTIDLTNFNEK